MDTIQDDAVARAEGKPVLSVENISKAYGRTQALDGVDLHVGAGEILGLMGANGAGKSTLVKILCGVQPMDAGAVVLNGRAFAPKSPGEARAAGIVAVHQSVADVGILGLSVADNLLLDRFCTGAIGAVVSRTALRRDARKLADSVGLTIDVDERLENVSLASRQLIAIARAVSYSPSVMLFDEPTASLSSAETERLFDVIEGLRQRGVAIIYISHKTADLRRLADRCVVLRDGRVAANVSKPIDFHAVLDTMVGRALGQGQRRNAVPASGAPVLQMTGARLRRSEAPFDLEVRAGEILAITGPVGAGKTALAGALFGRWPLEAGHMTLDGRPWSPSGPADAIARGVFHAGEDRWRTSFFPANIPFATIAGTIGFPFLRAWSRAGLVDIGRETRAARDSIVTFGIKARGPDALLTDLSGGNQQKVVLARWQAEPSRLLLLDEPFQGVDVGAREDIIAAIRKKADGRATIVFVNDYEEALEVGDRILVMDRNTIIPASAAQKNYSGLAA